MNVTKALGSTYATAKAIGVRIGKKKALPVSVSTGGGQAAVEYPPTVQAPPNATKAVAQQLRTSTQLEENTETTNGIGANKKSVPVTIHKNSANVYWVLVFLGGLLVVTFAWDRGKL
jgi:hypothetical protein